jgi:2-iminobutanoate/2-iminopropanoate deaminase
MGAYSPAVRAGNLLFVSGQIPINPATGELVSGGITAEAEQALRNVSALLKAAGLGFEHVVRTTVFLADMNDFPAMNEVYSRYVVEPPPARATVQVARLPRDVRIEIDAIAVIP